MLKQIQKGVSGTIRESYKISYLEARKRGKGDQNSVKGNIGVGGVSRSKPSKQDVNLRGKCRELDLHM